MIILFSVFIAIIFKINKKHFLNPPQSHQVLYSLLLHHSFLLPPQRHRRSDCSPWHSPWLARPTHDRQNHALLQTGNQTGSYYGFSRLSLFLYIINHNRWFTFIFNTTTTTRPQHHHYSTTTTSTTPHRSWYWGPAQREYRLKMRPLRTSVWSGSSLPSGVGEVLHFI